MIVEFLDPELERLCLEDIPKLRMAAELVRSYRKLVQLLRNVGSDQELRDFKACRLEKLKGDRAGQHSLRLRDGFRLIVEFRTGPDGRIVVVIEIVDYH